jgi:two-component system KDP operon response regulator KdpE
MLAASHQPDLILLDLGLPDKSGQELLTELRQWFTKPILILSVLNSESEIVKALDNGATDYLTKPFRTGELLARIRSALRNNRDDISDNSL